MASPAAPPSSPPPPPSPPSSRPPGVPSPQASANDASGGAEQATPASTTLAGRVEALRSLLRYDGLAFRRAAYTGAVHFPEWFRRHSPPAIGSVFYGVLASRRRIIEANLAQVLGAPRGSLAVRRAALTLFQRYAECLTDALEASGRPDRPFACESVNAHYLIDALAANRGVILVTAHTGSWEVGGRMLALTRNLRLTMVMAEEPDPGARAYADSLRRSGNVDVVYASGHDPATALTLLSRLRRGEVVAIQMDRPPPSGTSLETTLCGVPFDVPAGPFRLAQAARAPVVPVFLHRAGYRRYVMTIAPTIEIERRGGDAAVRDAAQRAVRALEAFVRAHPDQWFHFVPLRGVR